MYRGSTANKYRGSKVFNQTQEKFERVKPFLEQNGPSTTKEVAAFLNKDYVYTHHLLTEIKDIGLIESKKKKGETRWRIS